MKKLCLPLFFLGIFTMSSQDFKASFTLSYSKNDTLIKESYRNTMYRVHQKRYKKEHGDTIGFTKMYERIDSLISNQWKVWVDPLTSIKELKLERKDSVLTIFNIKNNDSILSFQEHKTKDDALFESEILSIKEDKNDKKVISGYNCFKVILIAIIDINKPILTKKTYEMYVTNEVNIQEHPIIEFESILNQYYPVEVTSIQNITRGFELKCTLQELKTNP